MRQREEEEEEKKVDDDDEEKCFASQHFFDCVLFTVGRFVLTVVFVSCTFGLSHPLNWGFGSIIFDAEHFLPTERFWYGGCLRGEKAERKMVWENISNSSLYTKLWNNEETLQMKLLEIGIAKKYHKIYVAIQKKTNKQNLSQDMRDKWNEHVNLLKKGNRIFLLTQLYTHRRSHTAYEWNVVSGIGWRRAIDMWQWNYFLFANQLIRLLISLHFVCLCRVCAVLCVIWKQQIDHRIEHEEKTNSQMIAETEANIVNCLREFCGYEASLARIRIFYGCRKSHIATQDSCRLSVMFTQCIPPALSCGIEKSI